MVANKAVFLAFLLSVALNEAGVGGVQLGGLPDPVVTVPLSNGKSVSYSGKLELSDQKGFFASFSGIRYAKPPVGHLRFQFDMYEGLSKENGTKLLPVMVWIHGGGFVWGSSHRFIYGPTYLMDRPVLLVTINYRLQALGFLSTEDQKYPGNMGLLDQTQALKWVQKNIRYFGGNPDKVTIFGESAGGASTHFQMLSPLSKGLFHHVISQSGVAVSPWAIQVRSLENAKALAKKLECPDENKASMMECLSQVPARDLTVAVGSFFKLGLLPFIFVPRVDREATTPFLPDHPRVLMETGRFNKVPWLAGGTRNEALFFVLGSFVSDELRQLTKEHWGTQSKLMYLLGTYFEDKDEVLELIESHYFDEPWGGLDSIFDLERSLSDVWFTESIQHSMNAVSRHVDTYAYLLDHPTNAGWTKAALKMLPLKTNPDRLKRHWGTGHADDLQYLFKLEFLSPLTCERDVTVKELFLDTFTNFAIHGTPNGDGKSLMFKWPKFLSGSTSSKIFVYNPDSRLTTEYLSKETAEFWRNLHENYGLKPAVRDAKTEL
ncbi:unnamed protein product [Notodromas monacha]|uniref:Carboxylic ester hydrolase n=1 Tax=Notodromas monacha TaxID=399045 RepID=A0A7R9GF84_9CRUS|nr:unnamed protein product [Notodromas monacha]CAG0919087.1 unnamed protein product [Notodromas monacha]